MNPSELSLKLQLPHGSSEVMHLPRFADCIARQIIHDRSSHFNYPRLNHQPMIGFTALGSLPTTAPEVSHHVEILKDFLDPNAVSMAASSYGPTSMQDEINRALKEFTIEEMKTHFFKKPVEFYINELSMEKLEELAMKYLEQFGGNSSAIVLANPTPYHKFVSVIDMEKAFKIILTGDYSKAAVAELEPNKWIMGRYESHSEFYRKMAEVRRYELT